MSHSSKSKALALIVSFVVAFTAAAFGAIASIQAPEFYLSLARPSWAPPPWLFGPVWTLLYSMMAIAAWLVWKESGWTRARHALSLYVIQLALNGLWTWLYFTWRLGAVALFEISVLWLLIAFTAHLFWRHKAIAGILLLPYLAWVGFAGALTLSTWQLNPDILG